MVSKHARLEITLDAHLKGTDCNYFHVHTREATSRCRRSDLTAVNGKRPRDVSVTIRLMGADAVTQLRRPGSAVLHRKPGAKIALVQLSDHSIWTEEGK